jgi:glutamate synthase domain-containing protein 3
MAGGILMLLGLNLREGEPHPANLVGAGMHGGVIYLRGTIERRRLDDSVDVAEPDEREQAFLRRVAGEFGRHFGYDAEDVMSRGFLRLTPLSHRPYGRLYAH